MCDASDFAVGGVLQQYINNVWQPLSFFSKKLTHAETPYSAFDRYYQTFQAQFKRPPFFRDYRP